MAKQYHILILALLLTSCATPSPIALSDTKALPQREAIVFGRVKVIGSGVPTDWGERWRFGIHILPNADSKPIRHFLTGDGSFYWHLPPGGYTITGFIWRLPSFPSVPTWVHRAIFAKFTIPEETSVVYVGTLTIICPEGRNIMRIEDEYDQALQGLKSKFPDIEGETAKRPMHLEEAW